MIDLQLGMTLIVHLAFSMEILTPSDFCLISDRKSQDGDAVSYLYVQAKLRRVQNTGPLSESLVEGVPVGVISRTSSDVDPCPRWRILSPLAVLSV